MVDKRATVRSGHLFIGAKNALLFRLLGANDSLAAANDSLVGAYYRLVAANDNMTRWQCANNKFYTLNINLYAR